MDELFPAWRYHAVFTGPPFELVQAEGQHRDHAIVGQVIADLYAGPSPTSHPVISGQTPPGSSSPRWRTTCCVPPGP